MAKGTSENRVDIKKEMLRDTGDLKEKLSQFIKETVRNQFRKDGIVIGVSGGVDSAVIAALAVDALGPDRVFGLILPEKESAPSSRELGIDTCRALKIRYEEVPITPMLESFNIYRKKEALIQELFPHYNPAVHTTSLSRPSMLAAEQALNIPSLILLQDRKALGTKRLSASQFFSVLSLQNVKQRTRMIVEYMYAEKMNYAVCGTTNKTEAVQGLFVKYGDGGVDIEPIAHLYKEQVFALARHLEVIPEIVNRAPCPDTYSAPVTDEEWYFRMPYRILDPLLYAWEHKIDVAQVSRVMELSEAQINRAFRDFTNKHHATQHLSELPPTLPEVRAQ